MRTDYWLYVLAVVCFIIAALPYVNELLRLESTMSLTFTVIFAALGLIFLILGYSSRPMPVISIIEAPKPTRPPSPPPAQPPTAEPAKLEEKKAKAKPEPKKTKRRRKKA